MLYLLNTTIMPNEGVFVSRKITAGEIPAIIAGKNVISAVGHESAAQAMAAVCGFPVSENRMAVTFSHRDEAICLKVVGRLPNNEAKKELSLAELEKVGYELFYVRFFDLNQSEVHYGFTDSGGKSWSGVI